MNEPEDLVSKHIRFYPSQLTFLESIHEDVSSATRKVIHKQMNQKRYESVHKALILFAFGSSLGALGLWFRLIGLIGNVIVNITVPIIYSIINVGTIFDCNWWFISP